MNASAVEELLASPTLPSDSAELNQLLERENVARKQFREDLLPHIKAEFISGKVVMHSPARHQHNVTRGLIELILSSYCNLDPKKRGIIVSEKALCGFERNDYEPDVAFFFPEVAAEIKPKDNVYPVPNLIVEVLSPSTEKTDRTLKFQDYQAHKVREYWIVDPDSQAIEQYLHTQGSYQHVHTVSLTQTISPFVLSGLTIPVKALFDRETCSSFIKTFYQA